MDKCYMCHAQIIDGVNNRSRFHIGSISGREKFPVCDSCFEKWTDTVHSGVQAAIERGKEEPERSGRECFIPCRECSSKYCYYRREDQEEVDTESNYDPGLIEEGL